VRWQALSHLAGAAGLTVLVQPVPAGADVAVVVIDGRGFGHGVGMSQDGAEHMGRQGATTNQILGQFYPGTALAKTAGQVRVVVAADPHGDATLGFPTGGQVRDALSGTQSPGFPVSVPPGGSVRVHYDGSTYTVTAPGSGTAAAPVPASGARSGGAAASLRGARAAGLVGPGPATTTAAASTTTTTSTTTLVPPPPTLPGPSSSTTTVVSPPPSPAPPPTTAGASSTTTTLPGGGGPGGPGGPAPPGPGAQPAASSSRPLWAVPTGANGVVAPGDGSHRYRGVTEAEGVAAAPPAGAALQLVNQLDVEQYLRGMGEVLDPRWAPASLRVQAIAARTYAMRAMASGGEICATDRCQVYLGQQAEYPAMDRAVSDTAGQVLVFNRGLASTVYSANGGGFSATRAEGFGPSEAGSDAAYPYLRAAPYPTADPLPWSVTVGLGDVASRLGYPGQVTAVTVAKAGPSGRALEVTLEGSAGPRPVVGVAFAAALGLRSTLFTTRIGSAAAAPPAPPPTQAQAPPEDAAAIAASSLAVGPPTAGASAGALSHPGRAHSGGWSLPLWPALVVAGGAGALAAAARATGRRPVLAARTLWQRLRRAGDSGIAS